MPTVRFLVRGIVQGVGYRWFVLREARRLELRGWVSNLPDGTVEVVADGDERALVSLEQILARGPRLAQVARVEKTDVPHEIMEIKSFDIR